MLGKLIKYDLKYIYKQLIIFYGIVFFSAIIARLTSADSNIFLIKFIHEFAQGCTFGFAFGTFINATMRTWARLRQNFYGSESYLTHTLPISRQTLWTAKFITSIIVSVISALVIIAAFLIMFFSKSFIQDWNLSDPTALTLYILFILAVLCQIIFIFQAGFTGIIFGHRHNNNRIVLSVAYGLAVYWIGELIFLAVAFICAGFIPEVHRIIFKGSMPSPEFINQLLAGLATFYVILIGVTYFINRKIFARGVNVE